MMQAWLMSWSTDAWVVFGFCLALTCLNIPRLQVLGNALVLMALTHFLRNYFLERTDNLLHWVAEGYCAGYLGWSVLRLYVLRLVGLKPRFTRFFAFAGYVTGSNQSTRHFADSTAYRDAFGNIRVSTEHSSVTTDHLTIWNPKTKATVQLSGQDKRRLGTHGNFVGAGGFRSGDESYFWNSGRHITPNISPMSEVITGAVILAIPGLGFLCLAYTFLHYLVHGAGFGEQRAGQYDFQHIVIAALVSGFFNMALFSQLYWEMAIKCFLFSAPVFFIQLLVARIDAQRFQVFLKEKVAEQIENAR